MADPTSPSQPAPEPLPPPQSDPDIESGKIMAILCYIPVVFIGLIVSIVCIAQKNNAFSLYHAKQALTLYILGVILCFVSCIPILNILVWLGWLVFVILGLVNAASGKYAPVPLVGQLADKIFGSIQVEKK